MRISDWSSDVCSSDLPVVATINRSRAPSWAILRPASASVSSSNMSIVSLVTLEWCAAWGRLFLARSEEHTSELQSLMRISYAVFCLKKKKKILRNRLDLSTNYHILLTNTHTTNTR